MPYEPIDIDTDIEAITNRLVASFEDRQPGYVPYEGDPGLALLEEVAIESATIRGQVKSITDYAAAAFGEKGFGFSAYVGLPARLEVDITVTAAGDAIPAGFTVVGAGSDGRQVAFTLDAPIITAAVTTRVTMTATVSGAAGNGVPAGPLVVATSTSTVVAAVATGPSHGGSDAELIESYLGRLVDYLSVLRPGGVRGADMAALARTVPGVGRAIGIDLYDAFTETTGVEKTVTVFLVDAVGGTVPLGVKADVHDIIAATREPGFVIYVEDPTYTAVDVEYSVVAEAGANHAQVASSIEAAVFGLLDPARWGSNEDDSTAWQALTVVRLFDVAATIGAVDGVASVVSVKLNGAAADVVLSGPAPLPAGATATPPTTVHGTVS